MYFFRFHQILRITNKFFISGQSAFTGLAAWNRLELLGNARSSLESPGIEPFDKLPFKSAISRRAIKSHLKLIFSFFNNLTDLKFKILSGLFGFITESMRSNWQAEDFVKSFRTFGHRNSINFIA